MEDSARVELRDGLTLRVDRRGPPERPPVLLLHGFTGSVAAWREPILTGLAGAGFRVIAPDLPGHGRSDAPEDPERYRMGRLLDDLAEVLDRLGVERCPWVGYSMGGRVALGGAVLRPDRVEGLVLESASPGLTTAAERAERRRDDEALARRIEEEGIEAFVDYWMDLPLFDSQASLADPVLEEARARRLAQRPRGLAAFLRGLGTGSQPSFWERLGDVRCPTLLLTGWKDGKYEALARRMLERLPDARHESVAGAGHTVHLEAPGAWLEAVTTFLDAEAP